ARDRLLPDICQDCPDFVEWAQRGATDWRPARAKGARLIVAIVGVDGPKRRVDLVLLHDIPVVDRDAPHGARLPGGADVPGLRFLGLEIRIARNLDGVVEQ